MTRKDAVRRLRRAVIDAEVWEQRVLNAPSIEVGRRHHEKLDAVRAKIRTLRAALASSPGSTTEGER